MAGESAEPTPPTGARPPSMGKAWLVGIGCIGPFALIALWIVAWEVLGWYNSILDSQPGTPVVVGPQRANVYAPQTVYVKAGQRVVWVKANDNLPTHTVTGGAGLDLQFDIARERHGHTYSSPGRYAYYCTVHPEMTGVVVVNP